MLYKILINYFRFKLLRPVLNGVKSSKFAKSKNAKTISLLTYGIEFFATFLLDRKRKIKRPEN